MSDNQILDDLERKLRDDIVDKLTAFHGLCKTINLDPRDAVISVLHMLCVMTADIAGACTTIPPDVFAGMMKELIESKREHAEEKPHASKSR